MSDVPLLAKALDIEPGSLLRHALRERGPDLLALLDEYMRPAELTPREASMLAQFRNLVKDEDSGSMVYEVTTHRAMIVDSVRRMPDVAPECA